MNVVGGTVHLQGKLKSDTDYERVFMLTESVKGVSDINTDESTVKDSKQPLKDTLITAKVKGATIREDLFGNTDVSNWTIKVETKNSEVFLSGTVDKNTTKMKIANIAQSTKGVSHVDNKIMISK